MHLSILTVSAMAETKNLMLYTRRRERRFPLEVCNKGNSPRYHLLAVGLLPLYRLLLTGMSVQPISGA